VEWIFLFTFDEIKLKLMLEPTINEVPMKCYRVTFQNGECYDVFIPDSTDVSSCVEITDSHGDRIPFEEWNEVLLFVENYLK
jgi:hypothetical protein